MSFNPYTYMAQADELSEDILPYPFYSSHVGFTFGNWVLLDGQNVFGITYLFRIGDIDGAFKSGRTAFDGKTG